MSSRVQKIMSTVLAVVFLAGGLRLAETLNGLRERMDLVQSDLAVQARPDLLTNVLLSVGRALAVDYLWIGLQQMQQEGRYFDAQQRAEWICQLQPRFPAVWVFHSWNTAYNISVTMTRPEDRWRWVRNGFELLRDRGIPLNPRSIALYRQLAWIFEHKIGGMTDDFHWYYKVELANQIEPIVGFGDSDKYDIMAKAPLTWDNLLDLPKMKEFISALESVRVNPHDRSFLDLLTKRDELGEKVVALLDNPDYRECVDMLEGYLRSQWLYDEWKMDSRLIGDLRREDMYGPLDFRTPEAHAMYWCYKGLKMAGEKTTFDALATFVGEEKDASFDALNTKRIMAAALQDIVFRGRFVITDFGPLITPDVRFIPTEHRLYLALGKAYAEGNGEQWDGTAGEQFKSGHVNFLRKAISLYYQYGDEAKAREYWNIVKKLYPLKEYDVGMESYMHKYILGDLQDQSMRDINMTIDGFLVQAYQRYAFGDDYSALAMERYAKMLYQAYQDRKQWILPSNRVTLPPWDEIVSKVREQVLQSLPAELKDRLRKRLGIESSREVSTEK